MRCHYEVLGISRDADDGEIKKSYRKLAIQYHPDKNPDRIEEVTKLFHEIQSAYDVLSDKQERAWYDKHREAILKGTDDYVDDSLDVMHYFNPSVYSGFGDDAHGFYAVFRDVFQRIAREDEPYLEGDVEYDVPDFGDPESDCIEVVKPFYSYWLGYCTKKSYTWKDKYDTRQAPNRPTQRLMEKENKKFRDAAKRTRNEDVRALVAYVRKRDKRFQAYRKELEAKQAENKRKLEKRREEEIRKNNQVLENYKEQEWEAFDQSKLDDIDSHFDDQFGSTQMNSDDSEDEKIDNFYCIACDKNFKSDKALANHEKSKKHKENVNLIKNELADELLEDLHISDGTSSEKDLDEHDDKNTDDNSFDRLDSLNLPEHVVKKNVIEKEKISRAESTESNLIHTTDSLLYLKQKGSTSSPGSLKVREKKKKGNKASKGEDELAEEWVAKHDHQALSSQDSLALPRKKTKKQEIKDSVGRVRQEDEQENGLRNASLGKSTITDSLRLKRPTKADRKKGRRKLLLIEEDDASEEEEEEDDDNAVFETNNEMTKSVTLSSDEFIVIEAPPSELDNADATDDASNTDDDGKDKLPLLHKSLILDSIRYNKDHMEHHGKHILQQKYKEALIAEDSELQSEQAKENGESSDKQGKSVHVLFTCSTCGKDYPTRNKLFDHIKAEGHAQITKTAKKNSKKEKSKVQKR